MCWKSLMQKSNNKLSEKWGSYGYNLWVICLLPCENSSPKNSRAYHYVCRQLAMESPHDTNRLRYFSNDLFHMAIKRKFFIKCKAKEFDCWNLHRDWISNCNIECIFLIGVYYIRSFTNVERKSVGHEPGSTPTSSFWYTKGSSQREFSLTYKRKRTGPNTNPWNT